MNKVKIAFDVDGTLIHPDGSPRYEIIQMLLTFRKLGHFIIVWSGGGIGYAEHWVNKLGLFNEVVSIVEKGSVPVDIAIDDQSTTFPGAVSIQV